MGEEAFADGEGAHRALAPTRERLREIVASLEEGLVERGLTLRLALLAALAGEHTLLVGHPIPRHGSLAILACTSVNRTR